MSGFLSKLRSTVIPIVRIHGTINHKMADQVAQQLESIKSSNAKALAVSLNTPGGMPAQAEIISNKLRLFATKKHLPLLTFAEGLCASAGYYILASGDQVFAEKTSIVGSIGAISILWRTRELLDHHKIEVRKFTSSENLLLHHLDPVDGCSQEQKKIFTSLGQYVHKEFIDYVVKSRGSKLKGDHKKMFDGSVFLGQQAEKLGLVDSLGAMVQVLAEKYPQSKLFSIPTKRSKLQNFTDYLMG